MNSLSELTTAARSGTTPVAGATTGAAANVNVNGVPANLYGDNTFAQSDFALADGTNTFTSVAADTLGRQDTNSVTAYLPASTSFQYDQNGNLLSDGTRTFAYDDENQLISVTVTNNGAGTSTLSQFFYDGLCRRRVRTELVWQNGAWSTAQVIRYVYDGNLVIQERDGNNLPTVSYTRGIDVSGFFGGGGAGGGALSEVAAPGLEQWGTDLAPEVRESGKGGEVDAELVLEPGAGVGIAEAVEEPLGEESLLAGRQVEEDGVGAGFEVCPGVGGRFGGRRRGQLGRGGAGEDRGGGVEMRPGLLVGGVVSFHGSDTTHGRRVAGFCAGAERSIGRIGSIEVFLC